MDSFDDLQADAAARLVAAVLLRAVRDCSSGPASRRREASAWLQSAGARALADALEVDPAALARVRAKRAPRAG